MDSSGFRLERCCAFFIFFSALLIAGSGLSAPPAQAQATCGGLAVTVDLGAGQVPTSGPDVILGTAGPDVISGLGGDDVICGLGGDDTIFGGPGDDTIFGGDGNDTIFGGDGNDTIFGEGGSDTIQGNAGNDTIDGGAGDDVLSGNDGDDEIAGGIGDDTIYGGAGADTIDGGEGADTILGGLGNDVIDGGAGNDLISGNAGDDTIRGGAGDDTLYGVDGADTIFGGADDDIILGGVDDDVIDGGDGNDTISGNAGNDTIDGGAGNDTIYGVDGNDTLSGGPGNDIILGGAGNDIIDGGDGDDLLSGNDGADVIDGGAGNDEVYGAAGNDDLTGGPGLDVILGGPGDDTIDAADGEADQVSGNAGNDTCLSDLGVDTVFACEAATAVDLKPGATLLRQTAISTIDPAASTLTVAPGAPPVAVGDLIAVPPTQNDGAVLGRVTGVVSTPASTVLQIAAADPVDVFDDLSITYSGPLTDNAAGPSDEAAAPSLVSSIGITGIDQGNWSCTVTTGSVDVTGLSFGLQGADIDIDYSLGDRRFRFLISATAMASLDLTATAGSATCGLEFESPRIPVGWFGIGVRSGVDFTISTATDAAATYTASAPARIGFEYQGGTATNLSSLVFTGDADTQAAQGLSVTVSPYIGLVAGLNDALDLGPVRPALNADIASNFRIGPHTEYFGPRCYALTLSPSINLSAGIELAGWLPDISIDLAQLSLDPVELWRGPCSAYTGTVTYTQTYDYADEGLTNFQQTIVVATFLADEPARSTQTAAGFALVQNVTYSATFTGRSQYFSACGSTHTMDGNLDGSIPWDAVLGQKPRLEFDRTNGIFSEFATRDFTYGTTTNNYCNFSSVGSFLFQPAARNSFTGQSREPYAQIVSPDRQTINGTYSRTSNDGVNSFEAVFALTMVEV